MSMESLLHSPEFELPAYGKSAPADLLSIIEENHQGLAKVNISRMVQRGKYETLCSIKCQENPSRTSLPTASPEEIAEYIMLCIQYELDRSDQFGKFKVAMYGPPGKGRWEKSKHIEMLDGDEDPRTTSLISEGDLLEQQKEYIGELHSQVIAMQETVTGLVNPLLKENREMMKIVSDSQRKLAEIEMMRLNHELELRKIADDREQREMEAEQSQKKWNRVMDHLDEAGAAEALMKGFAKFMNKWGEQGSQKSGDDNAKSGGDEASSDSESGSGSSDGSESKSKKKKKKKSKKKSSAKSVGDGSGSDSSEALAELSEEDKLLKEAEEKMTKYPNMTWAGMLKETVDANGQWEVIKETLPKEHFVMLLKVMQADTEESCVKRLKILYRMKGSMKAFMRLQEILDETQEELVSGLLETAMS